MCSKWFFIVKIVITLSILCAVVAEKKPKYLTPMKISIPPDSSDNPRDKSVDHCFNYGDLHIPYVEIASEHTVLNCKHLILDGIDNWYFSNSPGNYNPEEISKDIDEDWNNWYVAF